MKDKIKQIKERFDLELKDVKNSNELESLRVAFLGKKGEVSLLFEEFRSVPASEKKELGKLINELKNDCESQILAKKQQLIDKANEQEIENAVVIYRCMTGDSYIGGNSYEIMVSGLEAGENFEYEDTACIFGTPEAVSVEID